MKPPPQQQILEMFMIVRSRRRRLPNTKNVQKHEKVQYADDPQERAGLRQPRECRRCSSAAGKSFFEGHGREGNGNRHAQHDSGMTQ